MKDWSESWQFIVLVLVCCITVSAIVGVGVAYMANQNGFRFSLPEFQFSWTETLWPAQEEEVEEDAVPQSSAFNDKVIFGTDSQTDIPVVSYAKEYLGVPYLFGGESRQAIDCSALTREVFGRVGVSLPRTTYGQVEAGYEIETIEDAQPGDLIFFENTSSIQTGVTHVGIYMGNREMIHASFREGEVAITPLSDSFYQSHWHSIRRVLSDD